MYSIREVVLAIGDRILGIALILALIACTRNPDDALEALVSDLGLAGANRKSALYEDGERVDRLDNENILDQLEARIRAKASQLDLEKRIPIQQHHE